MHPRMNTLRTASLAAAFALPALVACQLDALFKTPPMGSGRESPGFEALVQTRSDSVTEIPRGAAVPEPSIVVRAVVRDTDETAVLRLEVELRPVGTAFQDQRTAQSEPTSSGTSAYVLVSDLADGESYHWQARVVDMQEGATPWQPYGGNPEHAADLLIAIAAPPPPPPPARLVFTSQPTTTAAGATMAPVKVTLVNAEGSTITSFSGTVHVDIAPSAGPAGATLGGRRDVSAVAGVATFSDLSISKAGSGYRLEATADGVAPVTSSSFGINPGPAHHPKFIVQPSNTTPNRPITPAVVVEVHDVYGNVATGFTGVLYMDLGNDPSIGGATLEGSGRQRAAAAGVATFEDLKLNKVGVGYTIIVSTTNVHAEESAAFSVLPVSSSPPPR